MSNDYAVEQLGLVTRYSPEQVAAILNKHRRGIMLTIDEAVAADLLDQHCSVCGECCVWAGDSDKCMDCATGEDW